MAIYRPIQISYWQDKFVLNLTPEEKFFYIYLMTNSKTTQCGIYELPTQIIILETGYNNETVKKLLDKFIEYKKIKYDFETHTIFIINWLKYNKVGNTNIAKCVIGELQECKNSDFVKQFLKTLPKINTNNNTTLEIVSAYKPIREKNKPLVTTPTPTETSTPLPTETKQPTKTENWGEGFLKETDLKTTTGEYAFNVAYQFYPKKDTTKESIKNHLTAYRLRITSLAVHNILIGAIRNYKNQNTKIMDYTKGFTSFLKIYNDYK